YNSEEKEKASEKNDSPVRDDNPIPHMRDYNSEEEEEASAKNDSPDRDDIFVAPSFRTGSEEQRDQASQAGTPINVETDGRPSNQNPATQSTKPVQRRRLRKLVAIESDITKIKEAEEAIRLQKEYIEEIYKEVTDSINYAKRIQSAALPNIEDVRNYLSDIFVLFKPKDVISGDFYWFAKVENQLVITAADCTGHGVPGAIMSMLGMIILREIVVKEYITQPDVILRKLRKEIIRALGQTGAPGEQKDGMDMSLCSINVKTRELQWAGANNPLWLVNVSHLEDVKHLEEVKPDKMPIGIYVNMDKFTLYEMQLQKGDVLYMTSDGFSDQFGGPKGKKFMSKRLKELLLKISDKPMKEQKEILDKTIEDWKSNYGVKFEQTDDITVVGLKI
ncbi:MAG: SpoIIE family protein phosphatase, partial [Bacteroidia bacterium]|nr:SpoIIE family protein phosphatase [Bacteroidia bacterium]